MKFEMVIEMQWATAFHASQSLNGPGCPWVENANNYIVEIPPKILVYFGLISIDQKDEMRLRYNFKPFNIRLKPIFNWYGQFWRQ